MSASERTQGFGLVLAAMVLVGALLQPARAQREPVAVDLVTEGRRALTVRTLRERAQVRREAAHALARQRGWPIRGEVNGRTFELLELDDGRPEYAITHNVNAAISTAANLIRNQVPYAVNGAGFTVGIWDSGSLRLTHNEFGGRAVSPDGAAVAAHSTHVGGTIGGGGTYAPALGMAPSASLATYDWTSAESEMAGRAASAPGQAGKIYLSNHSYGYVTGWETGTWSGSSGPHYFGWFGEREDRNLGAYSSRASQWDALAHAAPYYLIFKSAGNDRNDARPGDGQTYYYYNASWNWMTGTYNSATGPYADGWDNGGYDTISDGGCAKNVLTVGSVNDAVSGGVRSIANATMSAFSGWGPMDDGRVKPDLVANGESLTSAYSSSDSAYASSSGTSMSSPNACGSALLLIDYYDSLFPGQAMRASTLKALLLHTADDLGTAGPDYSNGWGLLNAKAAADLLATHQSTPELARLTETSLTSATPLRTMTFSSTGSTTLRATLCWTDPAHSVINGLDTTTPALVNDLDLRIIGPGAVTHYPYRLNRTSPASAATRADNTVDNVEQVEITAPSAGAYVLTVGHKGVLNGGLQAYSLVISGQSESTSTTTTSSSTTTLATTTSSTSSSSSSTSSTSTTTSSSTTSTTTTLPKVELVVMSAFGLAHPPVGTNVYTMGSSVSAVVTGMMPAVAQTDTERRVAVLDGWSGSGSVPATGLVHEVSFVLLTNSVLDWRWVVTDHAISNRVDQTAVHIRARDTVTAGAGYRVEPPGDVQLEAGHAVRLVPGFAVVTGATLRVHLTP